MINTIIEPELAWEGGNLPVLKSVVGAAETRIRELRDPCVFEDFDEQVYLFYSGSGERGIGVVKLFDI